jgi:YHS domain-containing protein
MKNSLLAFAFVGLLVSLASAQAPAFKKASADEIERFANIDANGLALQGFDPIAYFTDNKPVKGNPSISFTHEGATYYFASEEHKNLFKATPEKYEPSFGGFCAAAAYLGRKSDVDPENHWHVMNGRLFLQHNDRAEKLWKEAPDNWSVADRNWPYVVGSGGKQIDVEALNKVVPVKK